MAVHKLTVAVNYVSWSLWMGVRELIQNYLDACDDGYTGEMTFSMKRDGSTGTLRLFNRGASLSLQNLIMGGTGKLAGSGRRGTHGEGMELAFLSLWRIGYQRLRVKGAGLDEDSSREKYITAWDANEDDSGDMIRV